MDAGTTTTHADPQARAGALLARHGQALLRTARRVSLCSDDAHDALQRALEIYLRRLDTVDPRTEAAWMRVVVRNEALAVRKSRSQLLDGDEVDFDAHVDDRQRSAQERMESSERVTRSAEALRQLKPDEARALLMKAEGLSYTEIGEQLGWTYTKVNRCITEGRARFRKIFGGIESGEQCERFEPLLMALAQGAAGAEDLVTLKPHLRHCVACRAQVRQLHGIRRPLAAFLPLPAFLDRLAPSQVKADLYALFGRLGTAEPITQSLAAGGGRGVSATALVSLCLAGAGGYCALGGPLPGSAKDREPAAKVEKPPAAVSTATPAPAAAALATPRENVSASATETPTREPASRRTAERRRAPKAAAPAESTEFSFEGAGSPPPASAPAPSGSEPAAQPAATSSPPQPAGDSGEPAPTTSEFGFEG